MAGRDLKSWKAEDYDWSEIVSAEAGEFSLLYAVPGPLKMEAELGNRSPPPSPAMFSSAVSPCLQFVHCSFMFALFPPVLSFEPRAVPLTYTLALFIFHFWDRVLVSCPGWAHTCRPLASASQDTGISGMHYHTWLVFPFLRNVCKKD